MSRAFKDAQFIPRRIHKWKLVIEDLKQQDSTGKLVHHLNKSFGNYNDARSAFYKLPLMSDVEQDRTNKAMGRAWLVRDDGTALSCSYVHSLPGTSQHEQI